MGRCWRPGAACGPRWDPRPAVPMAPPLRASAGSRQQARLRHVGVERATAHRVEDGDDLGHVLGLWTQPHDVNTEAAQIVERLHQVVDPRGLV